MKEKMDRPTNDDDVAVTQDGVTTVFRRAGRADVPAISRSLSRAFFTDPVASWLLPDVSRRHAILERFFQLALDKIHLRHQEVYVAGEGVAAAMWDPPGTWRPSPVDLIRVFSGLAPFMLSGLVRGFRVQTLLERKHPRVGHFYLAVLGTDPEHQNRGIGSALLRHVLVRCDAEGIPAYLEASSEDNRRLYLRHGFTVSEEIVLPGGGPPMWLMWREPRG
jgi:ribosomal protein S18 acetylase RimI-like enzyme